MLKICTGVDYCDATLELCGATAADVQERDAGALESHADRVARLEENKARALARKVCVRDAIHFWVVNLHTNSATATPG